MPYQPTDYEKGFFKWIFQVVENLVPVPVVIYANQAEAVQPERPFISIQTLTVNTKQHPAKRVTNVAGTAPDTFVERVAEERSGTVTIQVFAEDHKQTLDLIDSSIHSAAIQELLDGVGLTVNRSIAMTDTTALASTVMEGRSAADFPFMYRKISQFDTEAVETVTTTVTGI